MRNEEKAASVKDSLQSFTEEVSLLESSSDTPDETKIRSLTLRIRREILEASVGRVPLIEEARSFAELLNRLKCLKRER